MKTNIDNKLLLGLFGLILGGCAPVYYPQQTQTYPQQTRGKNNWTMSQYFIVEYLTIKCYQILIILFYLILLNFILFYH